MTASADREPGDHARLSEAQALQFLAEGDLEVLGRIPWASNVTLLARVRRGGLDGLAVYKPARGERPLWDFPSGTLYRREVAAFLVSQRLGWDLVPPTLARDGPLGEGSVQLFVEADTDLTAFELLAARDPALPRIAAFDVVINNADRKAGHCLAVAGGRVWAIDHGVCFHVEPKLRTVLWDLAGQRLEPALLAACAELADDAAAGGLGAHLRELLADDEVSALAARAERLARVGRLPGPRGGRSYPWPLI